MITEFKIIKGSWENGEYNFNVQVLHDNIYCGIGKFVRTYRDALAYITDYIATERSGNEKD